MTKKEIKELIITKKPDHQTITLAINQYWNIKRNYWKPYKED
jgi:hypothetical protein